MPEYIETASLLPNSELSLKVRHLGSNLSTTVARSSVSTTLPIGLPAIITTYIAAHITDTARAVARHVADEMIEMLVHHAGVDRADLLDNRFPGVATGEAALEESQRLLDLLREVVEDGGDPQVPALLYAASVLRAMAVRW